MTTTPPDDEALLREAARIIIQLNEDPEDTAALKQRDEFLARGSAEREAFTRTLKTVTIGVRRVSRKPILTIALCGLALSATMLAAYLGYHPIRIAMLADWQTSYVNEDVVLSSGDKAYLDAGSAISDDTIGAARHVRLLKGAGFFDVDASRQSFTVQAGPIRATAYGTAFEVSLTQNEIMVAVSEGIVEVTAIDQTSWRLGAGERLFWSAQTGVTQDLIAPKDVAGWRQNHMITNGMAFGQVIEILDRRLPGKIVILDEELARSKMTGALDLSRPETALKVVTAARQARSFSLSPFLQIVRSEK